MSRPVKREGLNVHEVRDGFIIYDAEADRVHYLNPTAALLFQLCDGERYPTQVATLVAQVFDLDHPPVREVEEGLQQLVAEGVLTV